MRLARIHNINFQVDSFRSPFATRRGLEERGCVTLHVLVEWRDGSFPGNLRCAAFMWTVFRRAALQCAILAPWSCTLLWAATSMYFSLTSVEFAMTTFLWVKAKLCGRTFNPFLCSS